MRKCDLHIHSNFSDSDASVESIFKNAKEKGVDCIAITDHDTIDGLESARTYSKIYDIELVEGIELSVVHKNTEVHILAYFINLDNEKLKKELAYIKNLRKKRIQGMGRKLNSLGVDVDMEELFATIKGATPTRLHLALYLLRKGRVKTLRQAFEKYLSPGRPAYSMQFKRSAKEVISLIKSFEGLSFVAHPHIIFDQSWIEEFISFGVDGLETIYPSMSEVKRSFYKELAVKFELLQSGGSDAHGSYKKFVDIGAVSVPYDWVKEMKVRLRKI